MSMLDLLKVAGAHTAYSSKSMFFFDVDESVQVADHSSLNFGQYLGIHIYLKPLDFDGTYGIVGQRDAASPTDFAFTLFTLTGANAGKVMLRTTSSGATATRREITTSLTLNIGEWNHIFIQQYPISPFFNAFINGVKDSSPTLYITGSTTIHNSSEPVFLGAAGTDQTSFKGSIHEIAFFSSDTVSDGEVAVIYNNGIPWDIRYPRPGYTATKIKHYWRMGNGLDTISTIYNLVESGVDGTPNNMGNGSIIDNVPGSDFNLYSPEFSESVGTRVNVGNIQLVNGSVSFRFKTTKTDDYLITQLKDGATSGELRIRMDTDGTLQIGIRNGGSWDEINSNSALNDGNWHHAVITWKTMTMIVDGVLQTDTNTATTGMELTDRSTAFGIDNDDSGDDPLDGNLDEVAFYDKVLSTVEAQEIYNSGVSKSLLALSTAGDLVHWWRLGDFRTKSTGDYATIVSADSPVGWWRLGEASGTNAVDSGSGGNDGTYTNTPTLGVPGIVGGNTAVQFDDASSEYVDLGEPAELKLAVFSLECWFKRTGAGTTYTTGTGGIASALPLVTKGKGEGDGSNVDANYALVLNTNGPDSNTVIGADFEDMASGGTHPYSGAVAIQNDTWYHAVVTYDGTDWNVYLNGQLDMNSPQTESATPRSDSIQDNAIGTALNSTGTPSGYFEGVIDEVAIYDKVLTQAEVLEHYEAGSVAHPITLDLVGDKDAVMVEFDDTNIKKDAV